MDGHARGRQASDGGDQEAGGDVGVNQEGFRRVAHAHALRLGVHDDGFRCLKVGGGVDVQVTVAGARLDNGHA